MRIFFATALLILAACGGASDNGVTNPPPPKKPDPYVTIRVRDMMDTTKAPGRGQWHVFAMLTGPYDRLNGISYQGTTGIDDLRLSHNVRCVTVSADSVGERLLSIVAFADTTTEQPTPDAQFATFAQQWYDGSHTLPTGWMVIASTPTDAWQSAQYLAGHGLTSEDPIKWNLDWTESGTMTLTERTDSDPVCNRA